MQPPPFSLAALAAIVSPVIAQLSGWVSGEVSTEICTWEQPRVNILRDIIYLDGGDIWWLPRMKDGTTGAPADNGNIAGIIFSYNLSTPFTSDTNVTAIFLNDDLSKAIGGTGSSDQPNYYDGGMLANYDEFFLYGGLYVRPEGQFEDPDSDAVLEYSAYQYGLEKPLWEKGFKNNDLSDGVTRYIAYGAPVSAPSENKAWYFSGMQAPDHGPIYLRTSNDTVNPTNISNNLIELDMSQQLNETWTNRTLPDFIDGRANAEVVWVPVGEQGILVVLGGVIYPEWVEITAQSANANASEEQSPKFMSTIDVYDIANNKWYQQDTTDGPGASTRGCAVVGVASDSSSYNIYYYGGFDGINVKDAFSDAVWVLSLPSFTWTQLNNGTSLHGRAGHKCFMVYPDQMMVLGGYTPLAGSTITCLDKGPVVMFNVTSGDWMDGYDPSNYGDYGVHEKIQSQIGGDASGGATVTAPASGWATAGLGKVFETSYNTSKISTFYPYAEATSTTRPDVPASTESGNNHKHSSLPKWVPPFLGVVLGLMFLSGCLVVFCLWRRRKIFASRSSNAETEDTGMRIINWMRGQQAEKAVTVTTSDDNPKSPEEEAAARDFENMTPSAVDSSNAAGLAEMDDTFIAELADTSGPVELHDTGLSHADVIQKHSRVGQPKSRSATTPSYGSFSFGENASTVSRSSAAATSNVPHSNSPRTVSPSPASPTTASARVISDLSGVTERDAAHLRQISEGSVSLAGVKEEQRPSPSRNISDASPGGDETVISPPTAEESPGTDYISAKPTNSSRKSVFKEEDEEDTRGGQ